MAVAEKTVVEYIDLTPTWQAMLPVYINILENGNNEGKRVAREELARMAKAADAYNESKKT